MLSGVNLAPVGHYSGSSHASAALDSHVFSKSKKNLLSAQGHFPGGGQDQRLALDLRGVNLLQD